MITRPSSQDKVSYSSSFSRSSIAAGMKKAYLSLLSLPFLFSPALAMGGQSLSLTPIKDQKSLDAMLSQKDKAGPALPSSEGKALADATVATADKGDIRTVWLTKPTTRYGHGVLGDAVEAGGVTVRLQNGAYRHFTLPDDSVFEDLVPRVGDLDGDGRNEVVLVRAYLTAGAALSVFGMRGDQLELLAESPAIGTANRWLNPSILADLDGSGRLSVGLVRTPHIGGQLQIWQFDGKQLTQKAKANGFSNHSIGSRALGLSAVLAHKGQKRILLPDARQGALLVLDGRSLSVLARLALPARPVTDFVRVTGAGGDQSVLMGLADGQFYALSNPKGDLFD
ncbi:MAG: hypothetical protein OIF58_06415 [Cohaesibacter sp.]|nr:hypothetical protein [Cohaesibacter sp.]